MEILAKFVTSRRHPEGPTNNPGKKKMILKSGESHDGMNLSWPQLVLLTS